MNTVISIIVNYSNNPFLGITIKSILEQSFKDWECIIIKNGNFEDKENIIEFGIEKDRRFKLLQIEESTEGKVLNEGNEHSEGKYILFFNSGDKFHDNEILSSIFSALEPKYEIIYGNINNIFPDGKNVIVNTPNPITINYLLTSDIPLQAIIIKRSVFQKYGNFREDLEYVSYWAFLIKLICFGRIRQFYFSLIICDYCSEYTDVDKKRKIHDEREKVLTESFSLELFEICSSFNKYKNFYDKKIFRIIRRFLGIAKSSFTIKNWEEFIYKKRITPVIKVLNKTVRQQEKDPMSIPVIIINYNRLNDLKELVSFLIERNHKNIIIADNKSTYPPLLEYYEEIKDRVTIKKMDSNYGHLVFWRNEELNKEYSRGYHIVTDFDIIPNKNLPTDYISQMINILNAHKDITKVGFALRIDDIPQTSPQKIGAIAWEKPFWEKPLGNDMYLAGIDTTFALYPPMYKFNYFNFYDGIRIAGNFLAKHAGFYIDEQNPTEEDIYYYNTATNSSSWKRVVKDNSKISSLTNPNQSE